MFNVYNIFTEIGIYGQYCTQLIFTLNAQLSHCYYMTVHAGSVTQCVANISGNANIVTNSRLI